jgi:hypothetical protein
MYKKKLLVAQKLLCMKAIKKQYINYKHLFILFPKLQF